MNFQQLEYIVVLLQTQNFVKAADLCSVTQATLSQMVKKIEEELGVKIFDRSRQPVVPTEVGAKIYRTSGFDFARAGASASNCVAGAEFATG
jgi:LysR family hydrogen peroxide-inducible transcriptional activator